MGVTLELNRWLPAVNPPLPTHTQPAELQSWSSGQASVSGMHVEGLGTFICPLSLCCFQGSFWKACDFTTALMDREQDGADVASAGAPESLAALCLQCLLLLAPEALSSAVTCFLPAPVAMPVFAPGSAAEEPSDSLHMRRLCTLSFP